MAVSIFDWDMVISYSRMRGWRVVNAEDSEGRMTQCLLLPCDVNGIMLSQGLKLPFQRFKCYARPEGSVDHMKGYFRVLVPLIRAKVHDELVEKGLLAADDRKWANMCGGILPTSFVLNKQKKAQQAKGSYVDLDEDYL